MSKQEFDEAVKICRSTRNANEIALEGSKALSGHTKSQKQLDIISSGIEESNSARCDEISTEVMNILIQIGCKTVAERLTMENGDHVFVVLGRQGTAENYSEWGPNAVIIDAWSGDVYPARKIAAKLKIYSAHFDSTSRQKNYTIPFDPKYHRLSTTKILHTDIEVSDDFFAVSRNRDCSMPVPTFLNQDQFKTAFNNYIKYKDGWLGLRWLSTSDESLAAMRAIKNAANDRDRYQVAQAFIQKYPNKAFARELAKVMKLESSLNQYRKVM